MIRSIILASVGVLTTVSTLALAQGPHRGKLLQELDLTEAQQAEIREIRASGGGRDEIHAVLTEEQITRLEELREEHRGKRGDRTEHLRRALDLSDEQVAEIRDIHASGGSRDDVRAVLTEEQQAKFDELRARRKGGNKQ
jgi:Spy/CpxP family protein refolding chaperone